MVTKTTTSTMIEDSNDIIIPTVPKNGVVNIIDSEIKKIEGNSGTTIFEFTVERSGNTDRTATVDYSVNPQYSNHEKSVDPIENTDFESLSFPSGRIKFAVGETKQKIQIEVSTDNVYEANEYFSLNLTKALNATLGDNTSATGIIENDDQAIISLDPITQLITEGSSEKNAVDFNVTISNYELPTYSSDIKDSQFPSVDYKVVGFGSNPVDATDFIDDVLPSGTLVFNNNYDILYKSYDYGIQPEANTYSKNITLKIKADTQIEPNESFKLELSNPTHATFENNDSNFNTSTIENDDDQLNIAYVDFKTTYFEANEGQTQTFILERSDYLDSEVSVNYHIFKAGDADQKDFAQDPTGTVTFKKGETTKQIEIQIAQDDDDESNEHYKLFLEKNSNNVDVSDTVAEGVIRNDDLGYNPNYRITSTENNDIVYGAKGHDLISAQSGHDMIYGDLGRDTLNGGDGNDSIYGGVDKDLINGDSGDDSIYGQSGNDKLYGNSGKDILLGGTGNDSLNGGYEDDVLYGESGDDSLAGNQGLDILFGGAGNDIFGFYAEDNQSPIPYAMTSSYDVIQNSLPIDDLQDLSKGDKIYYNDRQIKQANYNPEPKTDQYVISITQGKVSFVPPTPATSTNNLDINTIPNLQPTFEPIKPDLSMLEDVVAVLDAQINTAGQFAVFSLDTETYLYIDGGKASVPIYYTPSYYEDSYYVRGEASADGGEMYLDDAEDADTNESVNTSTTKAKKTSLFGYSPEVQQQDQQDSTLNPQKLVDISMDSNFYGDVLVHIIGLSPEQVLEILS